MCEPDVKGWYIRKRDWHLYRRLYERYQLVLPYGGYNKILKAKQPDKNDCLLNLFGMELVIRYDNMGVPVTALPLSKGYRRKIRNAAA